MTGVAQLLRLEIERPPDEGELLNLVQNPSGELGAWGWETPVAGSVLRSVHLGALYALVYTSPGGVASHFTTEPMPITTGQYVAARWISSAVTGLYSAQIEWLNAAKTLIGSTTASANLAASDDARAYGSYVAPASTAYCRLRFDHYSGSGGHPAAGTTMSVREVVLTAAATAGDLAVTLNNLLPTPSAEDGIHGWGSRGGAEVGTSTAQSWDGTHSFTITKIGDAGPAELISVAMNIQPGRDYALQARSRSADVERKVTVAARWIDAGGKVLSTIPVKTKNEVNDGWTVPIAGVATAPTNAAQLRLVVQYGYMAEGETHYVDAGMVEQASKPGGYFDGATADVLGFTFEWTGTPYASASVAAGPTGDPGVLVPVAYQNILGPTGQITIDREDLNVGSMSVRLFDAILDPAQTDLVRPGKRIRLLSVADDGTTEVLFAGKTFTASVKYRLLEHDEHKRAEVTLTAVDPINPLASTPRREGVATIDELPHVLEGCGVPWSVNGSGQQVSTATVVAYNDNAMALDQVAVTRDSALGYAWVDRNGVLQAWDRALLGATVAAELDETTYNADIDVDFDLERIINSVTVKVLRVIATSGVTEEVSFGPYIDAESYAQWGEHHQEFTVQGFDVTDTAAIVAYANAILAANATPHLRANSLVLPIRTVDDLAKAQLDLYDLVHVVNGHANIDENSRLTSIRHEITAGNDGGKWLMTVGFTKDGSVASSTAVPSPPPGVGDVKDEITGGYSGTLQDVYDEANAAAAAAAEAAATGTAAMTAANGKNKVTYSASGPGSTPNTAGDIWFVRSGSTVTAQYEGLGGTSWASRVLTNIVVTSLDAGVLTAGTAFTNALSVKTNFTLGDASTNGVIQSYNFAGSSVGVYIDKFGIVAKGGSLAGAAITGATITGGTFRTATSGQRVEIDGSSNAVEFYDSGGTQRGTIAGLTTGMRLTGAGSAFVQIATSGVGIAGNTSMDSFDCVGSGSLLGTLTSGKFVGTNIRNNLTAAPNARWVGTSTGGELGFTDNSSSRTKKKQIRPLETDVDVADAYALEPVSFLYRKKPGDRPADFRLWGFILEQVQELGLDFLWYEDEVDYIKVSVLQQLAIRDLHARVLDQTTHVAELEAQIDAVLARLEALETV